VARLAARVAAAVGGTTADAKSRAVSLDVTETLAVVALLGWNRCKRLRDAAIRLKSVAYSQLSWGEGRCCSRGLFVVSSCALLHSQHL